MKPAAVISLVLGIIFIVVCGICVVLGALFFYGAGRQRTQSIANVINESSRDTNEMLVVANSHLDAIQKVHAITIAVPAMTAKMRAIDTSRCPADFQQSYLRYVQAWEGLGQKLSRFPQNNPQILAEALAAVLSAKTGVGLGNQLAKSNDEIQAQLDVVRTAGNDVEATALRYGVRAK
jgi:hypothetical protein